jgi:hypothetical protein
MKDTKKHGGDSRIVPLAETLRPRRNLSIGRQRGRGHARYEPAAQELENQSLAQARDMRMKKDAKG